LNQGPASQTWLCSHQKKNEPIWVWVNTYRYIFSGLFTSINPSYDLGFTRYQGFDPSLSAEPVRKRFTISLAGSTASRGNAARP
jgi:hypothetical protein